MKLGVVVLAAGSGIRFKSLVSKAVFLVKGKPVLGYSLSVFNAMAHVQEVVICANEQNFSQVNLIAKRFLSKKKFCVVYGGARRQDSLCAGVNALSSTIDTVAVHDSARPFIDVSLVSRVVHALKNSHAAIAAVPVKATIKAAKGASQTVLKTVPRECLWEAQTPQVFKRNILERGLKRFNHIDVTDDAMFAEKLHIPVKLVMGSYLNIKITTPEDRVIAHTIAAHCLKGKVR